MSELEFLKALQAARAVCPTEQMGKQHVIIACMTKHKKQQTHAKTTPPFTIQPGIVKELADTMQAWVLNESACPPAMRQLPDSNLNLHDVDFYVWIKNILPKEDAAVFKQQFWHLFTVSNWSNTLTNAMFTKDDSVNRCMCLCALKKCPPLEHGIKQSELACWLGEKAGLTAELAKQAVELFTEQHAEYTCNGTTWNKAARQAHESCSTTTAKVVAPHPKQVPTLLDQLTEKSTQPDDAMIVNEPGSVATEPNPQLVTLVNNMAVLLYDNEDNIEFST